MSSPLIVLLSFIERKRISWSKINKGADIGFPCVAPVLSLKYLIVNPPFIPQDSDYWFLVEP